MTDPIPGETSGARPPAGLAPEDHALLERVAARVVELRLEVPALLTLETAMPLSLVAGQALVFFEPFVTALLPVGDYRRFARLIERREAIAALIAAIESGADAAHRERRAASRARRAARARGGTPPTRT